MRFKSDFSIIGYVFGPLFFYTLIAWAAASLLEAGWSVFQQYFFAADTDAAYGYAVKVVWEHIHQLVPAIVGCFAVRKTAFLEIYSFSAKYPVKLLSDSSSRGVKRMLPQPIPERMYPVLLVSFASLAVTFNSLAGTFFRSSVDSVPVLETLPGVPGLLMKIVTVGMCMPLVEEIVFRGIFFSRLERMGGLYSAAVFSAAAFGVWHLVPLQVFYAFFVGLLLAFVYAATGRITVPFAMHSICNITVEILSWTGALTYICTPAWFIVFAAITAAGFFSVLKASERR